MAKAQHTDTVPVTDTGIREKLARMLAVFRKRPETAFSTNKARAVVGDGLRCDFTQGEHSAVMDLPAIMGGADTGPTPGFFARAGISGCLGIGLKMSAIHAGLDLRSIVIDIETDFDDGAPFGLGDNTAAPLETRLAIAIETDAPEDSVRDFVAEVIERDSWFLALRDAQKVVTDLTVTR